MFLPVKINRDKLNELKMLADWQLRELGFDPQSVNEALWIAEKRDALRAAGNECEANRDD